MIQSYLRNTGLHLCAWTVYILILVLGAQKLDQHFWMNTVATILPLVILFYTNTLLFFPLFLDRQRYFILIIVLAAADFLAIGLRLALVNILQPSPSGFFNNFFSPVPFWNQFRVNLLFIGISFAYWYARKNSRIRQQQQLLEREILVARLQSLTHQINPHFLYNTLSYIYTKSLSYSTEIAGVIARLSDLMRYSMAETDSDGKTSLNKEVYHIKNFIAIQQMRFNNQLNVSFQTTGDPGACRIMPLLLATFVENAFKHGKLDDDECPVTIRLDVDQQKIQFEVNNRKAGWKNYPTHGIGLDNVRTRLRLAYPNQHQLNITDNQENFLVNLTINPS